MPPRANDRPPRKVDPRFAQRLDFPLNLRHQGAVLMDRDQHHREHVGISVASQLPASPQRTWAIAHELGAAAISSGEIGTGLLVGFGQLGSL